MIEATRESATNTKKKDTVFILGDSIVKHVSGYLLTRNVRYKYLVKVRSFTGAKVSCLNDYNKPTMRDFNPKLSILHVSTSCLVSSKTSSEIANSIIDLSRFQNSSTNNIPVSFFFFF